VNVVPSAGERKKARARAFDLPRRKAEPDQSFEHAGKPVREDDGPAAPRERLVVAPDLRELAPE
jgi:hypothetical protein